MSEFSTLWKIQVLLRILPRESTRAFAATLFLGVLCGLVAVAFHGSLEWTSTRFYSLYRNCPPYLGAILMIVVPSVSAWMVGIMLVRSRLPAAGSGIPQVKALLLGRIPSMGFRVAALKFVLCVVQVGGGASMGREGPTVQICAALVPRVLRVFALPKTFMRRFLPVASAAGIAAAFNTPIAAVTFVMEELMGSSTPTAMTGLVVAAAIAAIEEKIVLGGDPLFHAPAWTFDSLASLPAFLFLGLLGGILGVWFHRLLLSMRLWFSSLSRFSLAGRMGLGGLATGLATWLGWELFGSGGIAGPGYALLDGSLHQQFSLTQTGGLGVLKFFATLASYSSGGVGGIFSPVLAIGSLLGSLVGWLQQELPWSDATPLGAFALVGMGTFFASVIRAPITSILILFELTGNYGLILPLMLANMAAFLVSRRLNPLPIYDALLVQDGIDPHEAHDEHQPQVGELCVEDVSRHSTTELVEHFRARGSVLPCLLEEADGSCLGIVESIPDHAPPTARLRDYLFTQACLRPTDPAFAALSLMSQEGQKWLPVVDKSRVALGIFGSKEALSRLALGHQPEAD